MAIITHNIAIAAMGDRVVHMSSGQIVDERHNAERVDVEEIEW